MIRILIADDHAVVRHGLQDILAHKLDGLLWGEAENRRQVLAQLERELWDLLILDIAMPGGGGLEVLRDLKGLWPKLPILILSMYPEDQYGRRALKAGASGYMNKEAAPDELVKAVRRLLAGGRYVSPALAEMLVSDLSRGLEPSGHEALSDREFHVLRRLASGRTVTQISAELGLSVTTVSTYRARVIEKLSLSSTADLIVYAIRNRLVE